MKLQRMLQSLFIHSGLLAGAVIMVFPFFWMVTTSFKSPEEVLDNNHWLPQEKFYYTFTNPLGEVEEVELERLGPPEPGSGKVPVKHLSGSFRGRRESLESSEIVRRVWLWQNYVRAWTQVQPSFGRYFWVSTVTAVLTTIGQVLTSLLAAYAFVFFRFRGQSMLFMLVLATMMVPQQVLLIPDFLILKKLGLFNTYSALIVPWMAGAFGIFLLQQFFQAIPRDLHDAAVVDGCSRFGFLWRILIPLSVPPILTLSIFTFLSSWNSLLWPLIATDSPGLRTVQVGLSFFSQESGTRWELLMAASTFSILPLVVLYFVFQRQFIQGIAHTGLKG